MGTVPNHERLSFDIPGRAQRKAELLRQQIETLTKAVAFELRLPYELERLQEAGGRGVQDALTGGGGHKKLGWSFSQHASRYIYRRALEHGKRLRSEAKPAPTEEQIHKALKAFSKGQWQILVADSGEEDLHPLRSYLDANRDQLVQTLGAERYYCVLEAVVRRGMIISLGWAVKRRLKFVNITKPASAVYLRESRRRENIQGSPRPPGPRSLMETASMRAIAEALSTAGEKVTDKTVAGYLERWEALPFESFNGDPSDYWVLIGDKHAYKRYMRRLEQDSQ
jgi:hypothetical protein